MDFPVKNLLLQGDANAAGFTINNLDLSGLNLTKNSVGLGNVDNTSDLNKPVSTLVNEALSQKEDFITQSADPNDYLGGDKAFHALGALALQGGATTLQELSVLTLNATGSALVASKRNDWASSFADTALVYYGASSVSSLLGLSAANAGALRFQNASAGFIYSNGLCPIVFGYNGIRRMRLMTGLTVGTDVDPGAGCISASGTITGATLAAASMVLTGGATFNGDVAIVGAASDFAVGGNATVAGSLTVTSTIVASGNIAGVGNLAIGGAVVSFTALPTSDPGVAGRFWRSGADVKVSI